MVRGRFLAAAALLAAALTGCASAPRLSAGPALSKSRGRVRFEKTADGGTRILMRVENLAEPEGFDPPGYAYVAWVQSSREAAAQNVGALIVDDYRTGVLRTTTVLRDFELFVTVEATSDSPKPTGPPLLWARRVDPDALASRRVDARFAPDAGL
ncbi:MAG TPA: hypothetical protein VH309_11395 [Elusimicrobiota bacterium]|jgi:hypothetical protein|nr:hypothetical protein [Elusimicrobiota bacterium]